MKRHVVKLEFLVENEVNHRQMRETVREALRNDRHPLHAGLRSVGWRGIHSIPDTTYTYANVLIDTSFCYVTVSWPKWAQQWLARLQGVLAKESVSQNPNSDTHADSDPE